MRCKAQMLSGEKLRKEIKSRTADIVEASASIPTANIKQNPISGHVHINPQLNVYYLNFYCLKDIWTSRTTYKA